MSGNDMLVLVSGGDSISGDGCGWGSSSDG